MFLPRPETIRPTGDHGDARRDRCRPGSSGEGLDGLWFDVYAWLREDAGLTWVVDHPHTELDDEHPGHEIGRCRGFRFPLDQLPVIWARYQGTD